MSKYCLLNITLLTIICGCDNNRPTDIVIENGNMVIYHSQEYKNQKLGKYEYHIRDNSTSGWVLITDQKYQVGDKLQFTKETQAEISERK